MNKIFLTAILFSIIPLSKPAFSAETDTLYSKCGIYDVAGTVKLDKGNVFVNVSNGSSKPVSLKVLNPPHSLKLLDTFSVKMKVDVRKITGKTLEAKYVVEKEEIQVFPGDQLNKVTLRKEEECGPRRSISNTHTTPSSNIR